MKKRFLAVAAIAIVSQLRAQQDSTLLDEVIVTANKYPSKTSLTGKVVIIITREQLERSGGKDLSQLLAEQAGVYINGANSNAGKDKSVYLRGARIEHTLVTIDGVPVYDASGIGGNFDIHNMPINQIERIEILKGSQSTLYGSDAIAGVINIITRKPGLRDSGGKAMVSFGSNQAFRGYGGFQGNSGKLNYAADLGYYNTKGINEATNTNNLPGTDRDGYTEKSFQLRLGIVASEHFHIQPYFRYIKLDGNLDQGAFTDELDYTYTQKSWQAGVRNEINIGKAKLNILYNYNDINREYIDDSIKSRNGYSMFERGSYQGREQFLDGYFHVPLNNKTKLTAGVDFRSSSSDQDYSSISAFGDFSSLISKDSSRQHQLGLYAALNVNTDKGFNLELGNRLNFHSEYGSNDVFNINPSYLLNKKVKLFANLSTAYRTPSLYQLFSEYGNRDLRPESAFTVEAGIQYYSADNKFMSRALVYNRSVNEVIFFYFNSSTFQSQYINQDKQKDHGFEWEATYSPVKTVKLKAYYSFSTGKIITIQSGKDTTYNNLLRRPKHSYGLNVGYQVSNRLYVSSNLLGAGKRADAYFDNNMAITVYTTLKSYFLWDVFAEYGFLKNKLKVFADLRNITSTEYTEITGFNTLEFNGYGGVKFSF